MRDRFGGYGYLSTEELTAWLISGNAKAIAVSRKEFKNNLNIFTLRRKFNRIMERHTFKINLNNFADEF